MQAFPWHTAGSTVMYFRQSTLHKPTTQRMETQENAMPDAVSSFPLQYLLAFLGESLYNFHHGNQGGVAISRNAPRIGERVAKDQKTYQGKVPPEERIPEISRKSNVSSSKLIISRASPSHSICAFSRSRAPARQSLLFCPSRARQSLISPSSISGAPRRAATSSSDNSPSTHGTARPASCRSTRRFFSAGTPHTASGRAASSPSRPRNPTA